jgi:hypothetical protein
MLPGRISRSGASRESGRASTGLGEAAAARVRLLEVPTTILNLPAGR